MKSLSQREAPSRLLVLGSVRILELGKSFLFVGLTAEKFDTFFEILRESHHKLALRKLAQVTVHFKSLRFGEKLVDGVLCLP